MGWLLECHVPADIRYRRRPCGCVVDGQAGQENAADGHTDGSDDKGVEQGDGHTRQYRQGETAT